MPHCAQILFSILGNLLIDRKAYTCGKDNKFVNDKLVNLVFFA